MGTHHEAGLPEAVCAAYDAGLLDFPTPPIGKVHAEFIEVISAKGMQIAAHGRYIIRDEHGVWSTVDREQFRKEYEIVVLHNREKAQG